MGNALFYHLTRSPAEALLPVLIGKALAAGWRVELRSAAPDRAEYLDQHLWQGDGFLPHGLAGGPHDARQPVLLTIAGRHGAAANKAGCLMAVDGAEIAAEECQILQRSCIIFDGGDSSAVQRARGQWRSLTSAGVQAEYWSEETGRWQRKA